jgi:ethanolamine permease
VGIVISGNYFGWNFGLSAGGYMGLLIASILMAIMYFTMCLTISELSTAVSAAGGPLSFARRTMGPLGGFLTGMGVVLEYAIAAPVVAIGIAGYVNFLFPAIPPLLTAVVMYVIFIGIHVWGIKEYAVLETVIVMVALALLVLLWVVGLPHINTAKIFGEPRNYLPFGVLGIWAAIPYAMWFFLAIEMLPMLAEETKNPARNMPRGIISGMITLCILFFFTMTVCAGLGGWDKIGVSDNPLPEAVATYFGENFWLAQLLASVGLVGLIASFSGVILAYSRQIFALARAGYLPRFLARLHPTRRTPVAALIVPGIIGLILVQFFDPDHLILVATFGALISYITMNLSCIILRRTQPDLPRPYKVPLYPVTPVISTVLAFVALFASIFYAWQWFIVCVVCLLACLVYYYAYACKHVALNMEDEEAALRAAQEELGG